MAIISYETLSEPEVAVGILAIIAGMASWIAKGVIERPFINSAKTFDDFAAKRIEALSRFLIHLSILLYFRDSTNAKKIKEEMQTLLLQDAAAGYMAYDELQRVILIAFDEETDSEQVKKAIASLKGDIEKMTDKIRDRMSFHLRYSYCSIWRRLGAMIWFSLQLVLCIAFIAYFLFWIISWGFGRW